MITIATHTNNHQPPHHTKGIIEMKSATIKEIITKGNDTLSLRKEAASTRRYSVALAYTDLWNKKRYRTKNTFKTLKAAKESFAEILQYQFSDLIEARGLKK